VTDHFPREEGWDSSVREEPLGVFCTKHAFYNCPVCKGESLDWVIPIVDGGQMAGMVIVHPDDTVEITGEPTVPRILASHGELYDPLANFPAEIPDVMEVIPVDPELVRQIEAFGRFDRMLEEPRWQEAAARGRRVYEQACWLSEKEEIPLDEAMKIVAEVS